MSEAKILFDAQAAWRHVEELSVKIGPRFPGSAAERTAAGYVSSYLSSLGLTPRMERFRVLSYECQGHELVVLAPALGRIPCEPMGFGASTPAGGVEGEIALIQGDIDKYSLSDLAGKLLLVSGGVSEGKLERFVECKPAGIIVGEASAGPSPHTHYTPERRNRYGGIPTVRISYGDGLALVKKQAKRARVAVRLHEAMMPSQNVIADMPGSDRAEDIIVICGHYCSTFTIPAASDNAAGAAIMMELANVFAKKGTRRTLRFIGFGSEEISCRGSIFHAQQLQKRRDGELPRHRLCVNFDEHGAVFGKDCLHVVGPDDLAASARILAQETGFSPQFIDGPLADDALFAKIGVPAMAFRRKGCLPLHTPMDNIEHLMPEQLYVHGCFAEEWLTRHVTQPASLPFARTISERYAATIDGSFKDEFATEIEPLDANGGG